MAILMNLMRRSDWLSLAVPERGGTDGHVDTIYIQTPHGEITIKVNQRFLHQDSEQENMTEVIVKGGNLYEDRVEDGVKVVYLKE